VNRTLVVTNDFPPRPGGIQSFVHGLARRLPDDGVVVYASSWRGAAAFDAAQPFPVVRQSGTVLLPGPRVARRAREIARTEGCTAVWFGASAPLGLLGSQLRAAGVERVVASTHGHEVGWAMLPGARSVLRRIADGADVVTYLGDYTRERLAPVIGGRSELARLASGVDPDLFRPDPDARADVRARYGLSDRPVVVCVSRLVPRKGQDVLIRALPEVRRRVPGAALLIVGGGPYRTRLAKLAATEALADHVVITGSVPWSELPAFYAAGDVFAMPCRTRLGGADVEGLGIVFLEASATGLPVVAGDSGGAAEAVRSGETGVVVDGRSVAAVASGVADLLCDEPRRVAMGRAGRAWVEEFWRWERWADVLAGLLG
jgi:phosphatidylinositol alpha-1,6-mannosyltransferase